MSETKKLIGSFYRQPDRTITFVLERSDDASVSDVRQMISLLRLIMSLRHVVHDTKGLNWIKYRIFHYLLVISQKEVKKVGNAL